MNKLILTLTTLCLVMFLCNANLKPTSLETSEILQMNPKDAIKLLSQQQQELYQKALRDFLSTFLKENLTNEQINRQIISKITSTEIWADLKNFMIETLFAKFEMTGLSESFGAEIRQFPDNYFLTFEMYDLLHD